MQNDFGPHKKVRADELDAFLISMSKKAESSLGPAFSKAHSLTFPVPSVLLNDHYRVARLNLGQLPVMGKRAFHR
jgi:hypothetical protein